MFTPTNNWYQKTFWSEHKVVRHTGLLVKLWPVWNIEFLVHLQSLQIKKIPVKNIVSTLLVIHLYIWSIISNDP